jgi:hypothetical protein
MVHLTLYLSVNIAFPVLFELLLSYSVIKVLATSIFAISLATPVRASHVTHGPPLGRHFELSTNSERFRACRILDISNHMRNFRF